MGWFGEDSDEEVKKKLPLETFQDEPSLPVAAVPQKGMNNEDEDPLDSYMNSLSAAPIALSLNSCGRLDVDNEEEATAHWKQKRAKDGIACNPRTPQINSKNPPIYETMKAKTDMSAIFRKAGEKQKVDLDEIEGRKRAIDPLDKIDHSIISYAPFRKDLFVLDAQQSGFGSKWRHENGISCSIGTIDPITSFDEYSSSNRHGIFDAEIMSYLQQNGFHKATHVQSQSIPVVLAGHDVIVTSHTGSGKTLSFILPLVTHLLDQPHIVPNKDGPIALVLTPTRELAKQVYTVAKKVLKVVGGKVCEVTGGNPTYEMSKELKKGVELVVSTPGRFIDMVKRKSTNCKRITFVVLDEADKMLDMGFESQCASILDSIRPDRQTLMFSATFGKRVELAARGWMHEPVRISVGRTGSSSKHVDQHVLVLPSYDAKLRWLVEMLPIFSDVGKMIIFVASRASCDALTTQISGKGIPVDSIHGDKHQTSRNEALSALRNGRIKALVATDVASRGLDVTEIKTVINFDPAKNLDSHVHRVGRAGRLNKNSSDSDKHEKGNAYTLLTQRNADFAKSLVNAFQREGREVTHELLQLSMKSRHTGGSKKKWNQSGLGFQDDDSFKKKRGRLC